MYLGYQNNKIKFYTEEPLDKELYNLDEIIETQDEYVLDGDEYVLNDETYKEKQAQKEKERIAKLFLTAADVERGIYKAKKITFEVLVSQLQNNEEIDIEELKIELKANHFYRGNPYVSMIGNILGFTEEQLDKFFEDGNYEHLL